jgi:cholesterol transport system auxiliary component
MLLAGCGGLLPKAPERPLYRLSPAMAVAQSPRRVGALLVVATPTASAGLDTKRMALISSPVLIDYFADGEWVDRPPFLVKEALIEGFQRSSAFAGVSSEGLGLSADYVLNTDIRDFTAIYDSSGGPPLARVRIAAELITMPGRNIAAATSVTREARAGAPDLPSIVRAFDQALGAAVQDLIAWSATNRAVSAPRR